MKNLYRNMMLVAAAAMSFASCSEDATEDAVNPEVPMMELAINAQIDDTRVSLNEDRTRFQWTAWADEKVGIFTNADNVQYETDSYTKGANFRVMVPTTATEVYAYYPCYSENSSKESVSLYVSNSQYQAQPGVLQGTNAIDGKGLNGDKKASSGQFPMVAYGTITNGTVKLSFRPVACALALNIYDTDQNRPDEKVTEVKFEPKGSIKNYGPQKVDLAQEAKGETFVYTGGYHGAITVTLGTPAAIATAKPVAKTNPQQVYICTARVDYKEGGTITVTTDKGNTYTFDIATSIPCAGCDVLPISLNLKNVRPEPVNILEGDYVVLAHTGAASLDYYAMSSDANNKRRDRVEFNYNGTDAEVTTTNEKIIWHIAKGTDGYTFATYADPKQYANYVSSGVNLSGTAEEFSISPNNDGTYTVTSKLANDRRLSLNDTYGFGFYKSSTGTGKVYLVPAKIGVVEKCTIDTFTAVWSNVNQTGVSLDGTYTNTYATKPTWSLTVSKDGGAPVDITATETLKVGDRMISGLYSVTEDGTYVFTLTATVNGATVATKTAEITKYSAGLGKSYTYTFTAEVFDANGTKSLGDLPWALDGNGNYWGYDKDKGQQFGSNKNAYKNMTLTLEKSDYATYSPESQMIQTVKINTSGSSSINAKLVVTVGSTRIGDEVTLTSTAQEHTFTSSKPLSGDVVLTYTQTSSKALYIKSISIN